MSHPKKRGGSHFGGKIGVSMAGRSLGRTRLRCEAQLAVAFLWGVRRVWPRASICMRASNLIIIDITLDSLRNFLDHVVAEAGQELQAVEERNQSGAFDWEAYEAAFDEPLTRLDIASRAVQYELVALIESEIYHLALRPWLRLPKRKGRPRGLFDLKKLDAGALQTVRTISEENYTDIVKLVEAHYKLTLASLPFSAEVTALRSAVNAFKHNSGFRRLRDIDWSPDVNLLQRYRSDTDDAYAKINAVGGFLEALASASAGPSAG